MLPELNMAAQKHTVWVSQSAAKEPQHWALIETELKSKFSSLYFGKWSTLDTESLLLSPTTLQQMLLTSTWSSLLVFYPSQKLHLVRRSVWPTMLHVRPYLPVPVEFDDWKLWKVSFLQTAIMSLWAQHLPWNAFYLKTICFNQKE